MPIPVLPAAPSRTDPTNFSAAADAWVAALPAWTDAANALEQSLQLTTTVGTSTTSNTIGTGSKSFTTQASKAFAAGSYIFVINAATPTNMMYGQVTSYNTGTGALVVNVLSTQGSGTFASWNIGLSVPRNASEVFTSVTAASNGVDANFYDTLQSSNPTTYYDVNDYLSYNRAGNAFNFSIGGTQRFYIDATDGPQRSADATTSTGLVRKSQAETIANTAVTSAIASTPTTLAGTSTTTTVSPKGWADCAFGSPAQTVQNMTGSRDITGSTFTNNTGRPILVMVTMMHGAASGSQCLYAIKVNAVNIGHVQFGDANGAAFGDVSGNAVFVVPNLATYKIEFASGTAATLNYWTEYR